MLPVVVGFIAGLLLGLLTFTVLSGGLIGLLAGAAVAALTYFGVSSLMERPRKIGDTVAELVPDGQRIVKTLDEANARVKSIDALAAQIHDGVVGKEAADFIAATNDLIRYVNTDPGAYQTLRHYINVYGEQTERLLAGYLNVERARVPAQLDKARNETVQALQALERTAAGELQRAVETKALALSADSEAIMRLASMDGYDLDAADSSSSTAAPSEGRRVAGVVPGSAAARDQADAGMRPEPQAGVRA